MPQPKHQRKILQNLIINKPFQLRFAIYVCTGVISLSFVYPVLLSALMDAFIRYAEHDPMGPELSFLLRTRREAMLLLVWFEVLMLAITLLISFFMSHRIAGPLYKLRLFFERTANGDFSQELRFREKDHFKDLAEDYNKMTAKLKARQTRIDDAITTAIAGIEKGQTAAAISALREIQKSP